MRARWRKEIAEIAPYEPGPPIEELESELGRPVARLSANESALGPSPMAIEALRAEASRLHLYPDGGTTRLREALAGTLGVGPQQIIFGNGADELIGFIGLAALEPGDEVIIPQPSFEPYATVSTIAGATVVWSRLNDYRIDLEDCRRRLTPRTKVVFLCNPHNPTGTIFTRREWERFLGGLSDPPFIVLDEAYRDFANSPDCPDGIADLPHCPTLIVLRTFSKIAGLAGLRIGYAIAHPGVIEMLNRVRAPYNINRAAQAAALAALGDREHWERTRALVWTERRVLSEELQEKGFRVIPSQSNFLLVEVGPKGAAIRERCRARGILLRDGEAVGFPGHLRVTVGTPEQNRQMLVLFSEEGAP